MNMNRMNYFLVLLLVITGLVISGCIDQSDTSSEVESDQTSTNDAESILAENNASLTNPELEELEDETKELDRLIESMDTEENITFEGF